MSQLECQWPGPYRQRLDLQVLLPATPANSNGNTTPDSNSYNLLFPEHPDISFTLMIAGLGTPDTLQRDLRLNHDVLICVTRVILKLPTRNPRAPPGPPKKTATVYFDKRQRLLKAGAEDRIVGAVPVLLIHPQPAHLLVAAYPTSVPETGHSSIAAP
eukprot:3145402-Rhodomonas_salina.1